LIKRRKKTSKQSSELPKIDGYHDKSSVEIDFSCLKMEIEQVILAKDTKDEKGP